VTNYKYIYGPVPSRRFGKSLGIDIIPHKICTYDCVYCQLGNTLKKTLERKPYYKTDITAIIERELEAFLDRGGEADYLTIAGSGEPTLNSNIGEIIGKIKGITDIPVVVLTNGALLWNKDVKNALAEADIVVPSMDAVSEELFSKINRPVEDLEIEKVLEGLKTFSEGFKGKIFLEIMFVKAVNDGKKEIELMKNAIRELQIDKVNLNTVVRPPAESNVLPLAENELKNVKSMLDEGMLIEVIPEFSMDNKKINNIELEQEVLNLLKRRPCELEERAVSLGAHENEILKYLVQLQSKNTVELVRIPGRSKMYYKLAKHS